MGDKKKVFGYLFVIFLIVLSIRLFIAFQSDFFNYEGYYNFREVESISKGYVPDFNDSLSYGGRTFVFLPVFHYILALFNIILPFIFVLKFIPNFFASLIVFVVYLCAYELSKNRFASLLSASISGFIPVFFSKTLNNISVYTLSVPLIFFSLYLFMKSHYDKKYMSYFIISILLVSFVNASAFIIVLTILIYIFISKIQRTNIPIYLIELVIFSTFFMMWLELLLFKNAFLDHGIFLLWQNVPTLMLDNYFKSVPIFSALVSIGFVPFLFGLYAAYTFSFKTKKNDINLLISFGFGVLFLLWLKLIELDLGLIFLGVALSIGFGSAFTMLLQYIDKTRFPFIKNYVIALILVIIVFTSVVPSIVSGFNVMKDVPLESEITALNWIKENTLPGDTILSTLSEGYVVSAISLRKNFMDSNFLFIKNIDERYDDLKVMYTSISTTEAVKRLNKYDVDYVYFSRNAKSEYGIKKLNYLSQRCFELIYDDDVKIYKSLCRVGEES